MRISDWSSDVCSSDLQSIVSEKVEEQIDIELRLIRPEPRSATAPLGSAAGPNVGRSRELLSILYNSGLSPHNALFEPLKLRQAHRKYISPPSSRRSRQFPRFRNRKDRQRDASGKRALPDAIALRSQSHHAP